MSNPPAAVNQEDEPAGGNPGENSPPADQWPATAAPQAVPGASSTSGGADYDAPTVTPPDGYPPP